MNTNPLRCLGTWVIGLAIANCSIDADAGPQFINGSISFVGTPVPNGPLLTATAFTNFHKRVRKRSQLGGKLQQCARVYDRQLDAVLIQSTRCVGGSAVGIYQRRLELQL